MGGQVRLGLPATREYTRVARAVAAVLGRREGFDVRAVNALQLDVGEAVTELVADAEPLNRVELVFSVEGGEVTFRAGLVDQPV